MRDGDPSAQTENRILEATLDCVREVGLKRLTVDHVARNAGVSRQTVYRHFGTREKLLEAVILREEGELLRAVERAVKSETTLEAAIRAAILTVLRSARAHPLLDRLLEEEPGALLPYLALGRGPVVSAAEPVVRSLLDGYLPASPPERIAALASAATRLMVSYTLAPSGEPEEIAATLAELLTHGISSP